METVRNALDNFAHGRRVFALEQLEAAAGHHNEASKSMSRMEFHWAEMSARMTKMRRELLLANSYFAQRRDRR